MKMKNGKSMTRRLVSVLLVMVLAFSCGGNVFACETQNVELVLRDSMSDKVKTGELELYWFDIL